MVYWCFISLLTGSFEVCKPISLVILLVKAVLVIATVIVVSNFFAFLILVIDVLTIHLEVKF